MAGARLFFFHRGHQPQAGGVADQEGQAIDEAFAPGPVEADAPAHKGKGIFQVRVALVEVLEGRGGFTAGRLPAGGHGFFSWRIGVSPWV
ncbi:MAG: hypothetical protein ACYDHF_06240 [Candidatus Cryosericum sp.]